MRSVFLALLMVVGLSAPVSAAEDALPPANADQWIRNAASEVLSFDFTNYAMRKKQNEVYFTEKGYESFYAALERSRIPEMVESNKMALTGALSGEPVLAETMSDGTGGTEWYYDFPITLTYVMGPSKRIERQDVVAVVKEKENSHGDLGIDQWIARPAGREAEEKSAPVHFP